MHVRRDGAARAAREWRLRQPVSRLAFAVALLIVAGCAALPRNGVPPELSGQAVIAGLQDARAIAGRRSAAMADDLALSFEQESPRDFPPGPDGVVHYAHLTLSGGGANGAFGAGFLNGWTSTGTRPTFKVVTGVSTGALMAPFAFLGKGYDDPLREFYTTTASRNIFRMLSIVPQLLGGESFADTAPLQALIAQHVDASLLQSIASAHAAGRRLYVGTVDLDSQNFIVWNMGLIAQSGRPDAVTLFRQVMLASASVPVAFPPVFFDVVAGGRPYDEMHVDGAVGARVFLNGGVFSFGEARERRGARPWHEDVYVIHNGQLLPKAEVTPRSLRGIAMRSFDSAGKSAVVGDLFRIYAATQREGADFHWITIPEGFDIIGTEVFDPAKMAELFRLGYDTARQGPPWSTLPPGMRQGVAP
jgi:predicted acylesterase/phospholipase RssA